MQCLLRRFVLFKPMPTLTTMFCGSKLTFKRLKFLKRLGQINFFKKCTGYFTTYIKSKVGFQNYSAGKWKFCRLFNVKRYILGGFNIPEHIKDIKNSNTVSLFVKSSLLKFGWR